MTATICPHCKSLLTTRERAGHTCPKCEKTLPPLRDIKTLSDRRVVKKSDRLNDQKFCYRSAIGCVTLAFAALLVSCFVFQFEVGSQSRVTVLGVLASIAAVILLIASSVLGYFGLSGGIRNKWAESIVLAALGLILGGIQLAFWLVSFAALFSQSGTSA